MNFAKFLRTPFLWNTSGGCFCLYSVLYTFEVESSILENILPKSLLLSPKTKTLIGMNRLLTNWLVQEI